MKKKPVPVTDADEMRVARLDAFALSLASKRQDAVEGRQASGIEREWQEDEEFYEGIDDLNRAEVVSKAPVMNAGLRTEAAPASTRSTVFVNITQPYVDMASARVADMLLPTDDMPFGVDPTPMQDVLAAKDDQTVITRADGEQATAGQIAEAMLEQAKTAAKLAETRIWDWLTESQWHAEVRQVIEGAAKIGTGILKGPIPIKRRAKALLRRDDGSFELKIIEETKPGSKRIDPRNFFPDRACGQSIHNGSYVWERDHITARQLRELKGTLHSDGTPAYIDSQIDLCLMEGPANKYSDSSSKDAPSDKDRFEIWYFHGSANQDDLAAAGCECDEGETIPVIVTMVNDHVIKAAMSTLDSGEFPYDVMVWQRREGTWTGTGVSRQVRAAQRIVNGATRNMLDNAGLSAGPQIFIDDTMIQPADGAWELAPRKMWKRLETSDDIKKMSDAIHSIVIPSLQVELMNIVKFGMELAERVTNMPLLSQGQQGAATDTVGGMQILNNNASAVLRRLAKLFDDCITEPHIRRYYEWLLLHGKDNKEKGDFVIDAKGSSALFERDAQNQAILQMGALVQNPQFGIDPKKWIIEALKSQKLDPKRFQYTEEEQEKIDQQPQPGDPRIETAKIGAQARLQAAQISADASVKKSAIDTDRDTAYNQSLAERDRANHEAKMAELAQRERLAMLDYANTRNVSLDKVKGDLAKVALTLKAQKEMAGMNGKGPQVARPIVEPAGRAPEGEAFQK